MWTCPSDRVRAFGYAYARDGNGQVTALQRGQAEGPRNESSQAKHAGGLLGRNGEGANNGHISRTEPEKGGDAGFDLVAQGRSIALLETPLMRRPCCPGGVISRDDVVDELLDRGAVCIVRRRHREVLDELLTVGVVAAAKRAGVGPNHCLA